LSIHVRKKNQKFAKGNASHMFSFHHQMKRKKNKETEKVNTQTSEEKDNNIEIRNTVKKHNKVQKKKTHRTIHNYD